MSNEYFGFAAVSLMLATAVGIDILMILTRGMF